MSSSRNLPVVQWPVQQWHAGESQSVQDQLVMEEPFEIRVNGRSLATVMRTPSGLESDRELAMGFLLTEGIIAGPGEVVHLKRAADNDGVPAENVLEVRLKTEPAELDGRFERRFLVGSSCGLCGKTSLEQISRWLPPLPGDHLQIPSDILYAMPETLRATQTVFDHTGGLHAAGLFTPEGHLRVVREDIGRHNAVDKLVGRRALDDEYPLGGEILLVSGRVSFEIVQKALAARIPVVAAVSAPSSLALELAAENNMTVIGFLRGQHMTVYTHPERVTSDK